MTDELAVLPEIKKASDFLNMDDSQLEKVIQRPGAAAAGREEAKDVEKTGKKAPKEQKVQVAPELVKEAIEAAAEGEEKVEETPVRELLTKFSVADPEGEVEIPVDLTFNFQANGKEYKEVPIDKVVKMAQMGFYNEDREQQVQAAKQFVAEAEEIKADLQSRVDEYEQAYHKIFTDAGYFDRARRAYAEQNTPEAQLQRERAEVEQGRVQLQTEREIQQIAAFVSQEAHPKISKLIESNPSVTQEEVVGKYTFLTAPLLVDGKVPLNRLSEVKRLIEHDLTSWVEDQQERRGGEVRKQKAEVQTAKEQTALAKRSIARKVAPPSESGLASKKVQTFKTAKDWLEAALPSS